jgi:hypothetical protein
MANRLRMSCNVRERWTPCNRFGGAVSSEGGVDVMRWVWVGLLGSCAGDDTKDADTGGVADADADTDSDTDADTDADTDSDADADLGTAVRIVHAAAGRPDQDMVVNGSLPPVLQNLGWLQGTDYSPRPPNTYTFQFRDAGVPLEEAWITFDQALLEDRRHTFVIYGAPETPDVLRLTDDDLTLDPLRARIRWTHVAPELPGSVDLIETGSGTVITSDLAYGASVELDTDPVTLVVGLDYDDDGTADVIFQDFARPAGDYFHVMVANDTDGVPFLLGYTLAGQTPRREVVP